MPAAPIRLHPDEEIVMDLLPSRLWTWTGYPLTLGFWEIWRRRHHFVLTNQRVIIAKGVITKSEQSVPLSRVQDAHLRRSPLSGGFVDLSTAGGHLGVEQLGPVKQSEARDLADAITPLLGSQVTAGI